jgi:hypothetical protein
MAHAIISRMQYGIKLTGTQIIHGKISFPDLWWIRGQLPLDMKIRAWSDLLVAAKTLL